LSQLDDVFANLQKSIEGITSTGFIANEYVSDGIDLRVRAPNAIKWITEPNYLAIPSLYKHVRQYQLIRDYFQLRCPICNYGSGDCWGKTPEELKAEILLEWDPVQHQEVCPSCKLTRVELTQDGLLQSYETLIGVAGMRSGKSVMAGLIGTFMRHVLITMGITDRGRLHQVLDLLPSQPLELAFVATTATQAQQTIWVNFAEQCKASPWFKAYVKWITAKEKVQLTQEGMRRWEYKELEDVIEDGYIMLNCVSLNSNSAGLAGRTRVAFLIDELSRFGLGDSKMGADEVWAVFDHSLKTVRGAKKHLKIHEPWLGSSIAISSPISIDDKTMALYRQSERMASMMGFKYATWEFNPFQKREDFDVDYDKDALTAERDFGANPPNAANPLILEVQRFWSSVDHTAEPTATFTKTYFKDKSALEYVGVELDKATFDRGRPLYIFGDAGASFDQFALVACSAYWMPAFSETTQRMRKHLQEARFLGGTHPESNEHLQGGRYLRPGEDEPENELTLVTIHEWSMRIVPEPNRPVWFESILELLKKIAKYRVIAQVAFDRWNSESTIQNVSNMGIGTQLVQLQMNDYVKLVQDAMVGRLRLLPPHPSDHLSVDDMGRIVAGKPIPQMTAEAVSLYELLKLERDKDLRKVYNPKKGQVRGQDSDDLAACLVGAHRLVQESTGRTVRGYNSKEMGKAKEIGASAKSMGALARSRWGM